ncbi:MAG: HAMP domain-containing sensor histidine kinase, partial [Desulfuromonadaceae bacterium]|nr:HAMP domain-containing sensor histidine kinase [Desulfuromonadaceae bacterium]
FLNELRHTRENTPPPTQPITNINMPAIKAILGEEGNFTGVDYRNEVVLSTTRVVPGTKWGIVAKIDLSEVLSPLYKSIFMIVAVGIILLTAMTLGVFLWGIRRKSESLRKLIETEKKYSNDLKKSEELLEHQVLERTRDLIEINSLLRQEIFERKQLEQRLISAKRLEAIGQIAGGVAHEVRNPLNAILTITEALFKEKEIEDNPEFEPFIHHIRTQVNRLVHLMNDLLDLGRTIPEANIQPLKLYDICRETVELWQATGMAKNKGAVLKCDEAYYNLKISADPIKIQQVIFNLLENAGYHTSGGKDIIIQLMPPATFETMSMAVIRITDHGSGIPEDKLSHVFDPFYTDRKGGTGLGLALVKHFTENMSGIVQIWNNDEQPGCTAEICIPLYQEELK